MHWSDVRARLADESRITRKGDRDGQATRYSATSRVDIFQTSPLTSRLGEASTGAGLSRHDDVDRTSVMLAIVAAMYVLGVCGVSHHR